LYFALNHGTYVRYQIEHLHLQQNEIGCGIYYPKPLHLHAHLKKMGYKEGDFPVAEKLSKEVLSLPVHPSLTEKEIDQIINGIKSYVK
jgi:dTDP-4-amino-4,6-dideoxygalactose transaminase